MTKNDKKNDFVCAWSKHTHSYLLGCPFFQADIWYNKNLV